MFRSIPRRALAALFALVTLSVTLNAGTPLIIPHQGRLLDAADTPLDGLYTITYSIFEVPTGGSPLWTESHVGVVVADGLFSVQLGSVVPLTADILTGTGGSSSPVARYLEIQLLGQAPISPRTQLSSSPYSVAASRVSGDILTSKGMAEVRDFSSLTDDAVTISSNPNGNSVTMRSLNGLPPGTPVIGALSMTTSPSSSSLDIGDLDGDGLYRVLATADSVVREVTFIDNGPGGGTEMKAKEKANRTKCSNNLRAGSLSVVNEVDNSCDLERATMKAITTKGTGANGMTRMDAGDSATISTSWDSDGNGEPESSMEQSSSSGRTVLKAIARSGSTTGTIRMQATPDSALTVQGCDTDGDGVAESSYRIVNDGGGKRADVVIKGRSGSTTGTIRMAANPDSAVSVLETDADNDGLSERAVRMNAGQDELSVVVEYKDGDDPITHKRAGKQSASATGAKWSLEDDSDGNGDAECRAITKTSSTGASQSLYKKGLNAVNVSTALVDSVGDAGFIRRIEWDIDNDGTYDMVSSSSGDSSGTRSILKGGMSGSTTGTIRMHASPDSAVSSCAYVQDNSPNPETVYERTRSVSGECSSVLVYDQDGDGHANKNIGLYISEVTGQSKMKCVTDSDDDGVEDMTAEIECNPDSSCLRLNGLPPGTPYIGNLSMQASGAGASQLLSGHNGSTTGTIRMQATPDSGVVEVGYHGSTTGTIRMQASSSSSVNPIEHSSGAHLTAGGVWTNSSDASLKENFRSVDGAELLKKIEELPVSQWNYKAESDEVTHIGPTAQDFQKVFGVGENDKTISTIDPSGIALAAIKELYEQLKKKDSQIEDLQKQLLEVKKELKKK